MTLLMAIVALLGVLLGGLALFLRADPQRLADSFRAVGPAILALAGAATAFSGRVALAAPALLAALAWWTLSRHRRRATPLSSRRSMVRTAALEMELDHDTGALEGLVLAGSAEGKTLGSMGLEELRVVYRELSPDPDSVRLLETYLDGRFPVWRHDVHADDGEGLGVAPRTRTMTKEEAYKVLGLQAGAAAADIRKAHRRLMQRLNPDIERSSFLAARIDEAKDVLLSDHG
ncbi:molecular chaperone DnaJ [Mesorhizobium sp. 8]|uniref:molecular chaperone DnaJ n=1 Tax=Mesorhizobium sp. 8 TaxID=2584466 RepID=UPI001122455C|nr:molecular chaperone DnaJ [Mesorhizobium sp. 8]QDB99754.1 molecular chaperone DnaJ [Mesorhizobium sp. 8]